MVDNAFFWLGLLAFFFVLWVATGGPSRPISFAGPFLTPISTYGDRSQAYGIGETGSGDGSLWDNFFDRQEELAELEAEQAEAQAWGEPSPYRGSVHLERGRADESLAAREYVVIEASSRLDAPVKLSGWRIVSVRTGSTGRIGFGTELPRSGSLNMTGDIMLYPGDEAIVISGRSPIGVSFRENICIGYLDEYQRFEPPLQESCPDPLDEFESYFGEDERTDSNCYEAIAAADACTTPEDLDKVPSSCRAFVRDYLTYNGCVAQHQNTRDFRVATWRIYLGSRGGLWKEKQEMLKLVDAQGKTVDLITY